VVGHGHILTGVVRSSANCVPIPNAKLELWPEEPGVGHLDEYRSTVFTDSSGAYRFECNPTDHIHMRISAEGYRSIASNAYHTEGKPEGIFHIVLRPDQP
jgi:protocatechuate 3,4-dioxygenase beta subunit